ncbi:hypothetical protein SUGI_1046100 [Cryptomeria japonica]|nr:hypothetical protein SUGI_1046100 [Cryptomeria japonica]
MDLDEEVQDKRQFSGLKQKRPLTGAEDNGHRSKRFQASRQVPKTREIYVEAKEEEAKLLERSAKELERKPPVQRVEILMSSAPPPAAILWKMEELGFSITHDYDLIETAGLVVSYAWKMEWDRLPGKEKARLKFRQGVRNLSLAEVDVKNLVTMANMTKDGVQMGKAMMRGASVMKGYRKNAIMTASAHDWEHMISIEGPGQGKQTTPFVCYEHEFDAKCSPQCSCSTKINGNVKFLQPLNELKDFPFSKVKFVLSTPAKADNSDKYTDLIVKDEKSGMKIAQLAESINVGFDFNSNVKPWERLGKGIDRESRK